MRTFIASGPIDPTQWGMMLMQGIASLVIGALLLVAPDKTITLALQFLGLYWLITGIFSIVNFFVGHPDQPRWLALLSGILGVAAGLAILNHPLWSTLLIPSALVLLLGIEGILIGLLGIAQAISGRGGWQAVFLGALSIIFGALLLASPLMASTLFVSIIAVVAVVGGIVAIAGAVTLRVL